jgi:hypothetical protein
MSIKGGMTGCKFDPAHTPSVPEYMSFTKLHFKEGIELVENTPGCEYTIKVPQSKIDGKVFDDITLGTGLQLRPPLSDEYCDYTLDTALYIKGGMTGCKPDGTNYSVPDYKSFDQLLIGNGLKLDDNGAGDFTISAPQPEIEGNVFDKITLGTGLQLRPPVVGEYCDFTLDSTYAIKGGMTGCKPGINYNVTDFTAFEEIVIGDGLRLDMGFGTTATISAPQPTIGGNIFDSLAVGSGLELKTTYGDGCDYELNSKLKFKGCQGNQIGSARVEQITLGAGLSGVGLGNSIEIGLDRAACSGAPTLVPYVTDIICVGSGLSVVEKTMRFTPEGLFIDTVS